MARERRLVAVLAAWVIVLGSATAGPPEPRPPLPAELALIPPDAAGFATVRFADLWQARPFEQMRQLLGEDRELPEEYRSLYGTDRDGIERATVVWPTEAHRGWDLLEVPGDLPSRLLVITTRRPMTTRPGPETRPAKRRYKGFRYYPDRDGWTCLHFVDERTVVIGSRAALHWLLDHRARPAADGPLTPALRRAADGPLAVLAVRRKLLGSLVRDLYPNAAKEIGPLLDAGQAMVEAACPRDLEATARLTFDTPAAAALAGAAFRRWGKKEAATLRSGVKETEDWVHRNDADRPRTDGKKETSYKEIIQFYRDVARGLDSPPTEDGTTLTLRFRTAAVATFTTDPYAAVPYLTLPTGPRSVDPDEFRAHDEALARALKTYHDRHGRYPPAAIYSPAGRPLLSWRVALLPHLGDEAAKLHAKFKLDEPWDGPHNKALVQHMPDVFSSSPRGRYRARPHTDYRVFVGPGTMFEGPQGISRRDVTDPAATFLVVRGGYASVPWTSSEELTLQDGRPPLPEDGGRILAVICADGSTRPVLLSDPEAIRAGVIRTKPGKGAGSVAPVNLPGGWPGGLILPAPDAVIQPAPCLK